MASPKIVPIVVVSGGAPIDQSRIFEKVHPAPPPFCFVSKGSHETTVAQGELMIRKNITYCKLPVRAGAGYEVSRIPMDRMATWTLFQQRLLCLAPKNRIEATVLPTAETLGADIGPKDADDWLASMAKHAPPGRGRPSLPPGTPPLGSFSFVTRCGLNRKTLTLHSNGLLSFDDVQTGSTSYRNLTHAFIQDFSYVRYTTAGLLNKLLMGGANKIEINFLGDKYYMDTMLPPDQLPAAHTAILRAALGREPSAPMKTYTGKIGVLDLGPEFTTVTTVKPGLCALMASKEVITVKTSDVSHLTASLPSWQNALLRVIRDVELIKIGRLISALMADDLALLPVWPCQFFDDLYVTIILVMNALRSIIAFVIVFFFRKTAVIFGGPGPAKQVSFLPDEKPEALLRDVAAQVTVAQASFQWNGSPAATLLAGAAKDVPDTVVVVAADPISRDTVNSIAETPRKH